VLTISANDTAALATMLPWKRDLPTGQHDITVFDGFGSNAAFVGWVRQCLVLADSRLSAT
jgi:hypothetical protein